MKLITCILTLAAGTVCADDLKLKDGTVLKNYSVISQTVDGLKIEHSDGVGKVAAGNLPDEVRAKYKWDDKKIEAARAAAAAERQKNAAAVKAKEADDGAKAAEEEKAGAAFKEHVAAMRKRGVDLGPFRVWLNYVTPSIITQADVKTSGFSYIVFVENTSTKTVKATFRGSVYLNGKVGDTPCEFTVTIEPGKQKRCWVDSIFSPNVKNSIAVEVESVDGTLMTEILDVPKDAIP